VGGYFREVLVFGWHAGRRVPSDTCLQYSGYRLRGLLSRLPVNDLGRPAVSALLIRPPNSAERLLVSADGKNTSLTETTPSKLNAGDSISSNLAATIPASLAKGSCKVEVRAKLKAGEKQYSDDNDFVTVGTVHAK